MSHWPKVSSKRSTIPRCAKTSSREDARESPTILGPTPHAHLVAHLQAQGDDVIITDRASGGPDITNAQAVQQFVLHNEPEVIYHLAGQSDVHRSWSNPVESYRANVEGAANVLAAAHAAQVRRVVAVLSADAYGRVEPGDLPIDEDTQFLPLSPYAASKVRDNRRVSLRRHSRRG
ncbi:MAG: NAD-dependent epimerase/dehydratase family protein [Actinobacteria bacterium]|nr:MAG: NAD-dependent epimerase/dehydratase family protein [Actinomycetota bacterium]